MIKPKRSLSYHTLFTSKFSCTGGDGHFPRWKLCPLVAVKRPARVARSNSIVTILGLVASGEAWGETTQLEVSESPEDTQ